MSIIKWLALYCMYILNITSVSLAKFVNHTIDDTFGDEITKAIPQYGSNDPVFPWSQLSGTLPPDSPSYHLDHTQTFQNSWHEGVAKLGSKTISFNFFGVAIYTFFIIPVNGGDYVSIDFTLDGVNIPASSFFFNQTIPGTEPRSSSVSFMYNHLVFFRESLSNASHSMLMTMNPQPNADGEGDIAIFDYAIYTQAIHDSASTPGSGSGSGPSSDPSSNSSVSTVMSTTTSSTTGSASTGSGSITNSNINSTTLPISTSPTSSSPTIPHPTQNPTATSLPSTSKRTSRIGTIVGIVLGCLAGIALLFILVLIYLRRRRNGVLTIETRARSVASTYSGASPNISNPAMSVDPLSPTLSSSQLFSHVVGPVIMSRKHAPNDNPIQNASNLGDDYLRGEITALQNRVRELETEHALPDYTTVVGRTDI